MDMSQKVWPFGNVKGLLVIKYLDCWQNTGDGLTREPQLKGTFSSLAFVLRKKIINNAQVEGLN